MAVKTYTLNEALTPTDAGEDLAVVSPFDLLLADDILATSITKVEFTWRTTVDPAGGWKPVAFLGPYSDGVAYNAGAWSATADYYLFSGGIGCYIIATAGPTWTGLFAADGEQTVTLTPADGEDLVGAEADGYYFNVIAGLVDGAGAASATVVLSSISITYTGGIAPVPPIRTITAELWNEANDTKLYTLSSDGTDVHGLVSCAPAARRMDVVPCPLSVRRDHQYVDELTRGRHVRWFIDAGHAATSRIISKLDTTVSPSGPPGETVAVTSFSHAQVLDEAFVRPYGGEDFRPTSRDRSFGPHCPELDLSSWSPVVLQYEGIASPIAGVPGYEPWVPPDGWPEPIDDVDWIFVDGSIDDDPPVFPSGRWVMRGTFTNPTQQDLWFAVAADDSARLFVDGILVIDWTSPYPGTDSFRSFHRRVVENVSSGSHTWSIELEVFPGNPSGPRRGMAAACVHSLPTDGEMLDGDTFIAGTDTTWVCRPTSNDYPSCTPHEAMSALLTDAAALSMADGVTLASTASLDANSEAWTTRVPTKMPCGQSLRQVLAAWQSAGICDWDMNLESQQLRLYNPGTLGSASSAVFTPAVDLLEDATFEDGEITNTLLVETEDGWELETDSASVAAYGGVGQMLGLAGATSPAARAGIISAFFDAEAEPKQSRTLKVSPTTTADLPGAWHPGDTGTVGEDVVRMDMWAARQSGKGLAEFDIEVITSRQIAEERQQLQLDLVALGAASGRAPAATLVQPSDTRQSGKPERRDFPVYSPDDDPATAAPVAGTQKQVRNDGGQRRVTLFEVRGIWMNQADTNTALGDDPGDPDQRTTYVGAVQRNGVNIAVINLAVDDSEAIVLVEDGLFLETDMYGCAGFGGVGLTNVVMSSTAVEAV